MAFDMLAVIEAVVAACTLVLYLASAIKLWLGNRQIVRLEAIPSCSAGSPQVSVVIAARDEEPHIEAALASVLAQDYPNYQVVVVDDRSTDRTGAIVDRMASQESRLAVVHVDQLRPGWLGKNHALHLGAARASGDFLLFSDADVVMERSVLGRAMRYVADHRLDHLTIAPRVIPHGFLYNAFLGLFGVLFNLHTKPWKVREPKSSRHIGIGAFNLVRSTVYRSLGGHERIAMRPDDDMKLGKLIKSHGYRQDMVAGTSLLSVDWYDSLRTMIHGLMKNMFASVEYSAGASIAAAFAVIVLGVWPFAALALTGGWARGLNAAVVVVIMAVLIRGAVEMKVPAFGALAFPLASLILAYIVLRSMAVTLRNGGIDWRGTHYPLGELRANKL